MMFARLRWTSFFLPALPEATDLHATNVLSHEHSSKVDRAIGAFEPQRLFSLPQSLSAVRSIRPFVTPDHIFNPTR
jgi:hypothetical protein